MSSWLPSKRVVTLLALPLAFGLGAFAHQRILHPSNGAPLYWSSPGAVGIVIAEAGSDDLPGPDDETSLRHAIESWNKAPGSIARLVEDDSDLAQAQTNWQSTALHLIWFDEDNSSGYFPGGSNTVAITPIWFFGDGRISDADVIFNGDTFRFTTSGEVGRFDVEDVGAHELGHLLGLDHSPYAGATMYPYVDSTVILHRSLSLDDIGGMRAAYPGAVFSSFTGRVLRIDTTPVFGAHVVAVDENGRTAGAILTNAAGQFALVGLDPGTYSVYVGPLDGPVGSGNLTGSPAIETDFELTDFPGTFSLAASTSQPLGDLTVNADVSVELGRSADRLPLRAIRGTTTSHSLRGSGLSAGSSIDSSDPAIVVTPVSFLGSMVSFQVTVPAGAELGHADLTVTTPLGDRAVLPAALEITPPDPVVQAIAPATASPGGGTSLTVTGTGFRAGARVVLGDRIYLDGEPGGCVVVDDTTITLTNSETITGVHDVVVIDGTGVEGRLDNGLQTSLQPVVGNVFPAVGDLAGGTLVRLAGEEFSDGVTVRIGGAVQSNVEWISETLVEFTTSGAVLAGLYDLEVEDAGGAIAQSTFVYSEDPDPILDSIDPPQGTISGGDLITLSGENFEVGMSVRFGADPVTGNGGVLAEDVSFIDDRTLLVETPSGQGLQSVLVAKSGGQADVLEAGFQFGSDGTGGGGCAGTTIDPQSPWAPLLGSSWVLMLVLFALVRRSAWGLQRPARAGG